MGRAAASRAESDARTLDELEYHWGSAYHIAVTGGAWTARRTDGKGGTLTDALPEGLRLRIVADYDADPVPRLTCRDRPTARHAIPLRRVRTAVLTDQRPVMASTRRNELIHRLLAGRCEICEDTVNLEVHHVRKLADLSKPGRRGNLHGCT